MFTSVWKILNKNYSDQIIRGASTEKGSTTPFGVCKPIKLGWSISPGISSY